MVRIVVGGTPREQLKTGLVLEGIPVRCQGNLFLVGQSLLSSLNAFAPTTVNGEPHAIMSAPRCTWYLSRSLFATTAQRPRRRQTDRTHHVGKAQYSRLHSTCCNAQTVALRAPRPEIFLRSGNTMRWRAKARLPRTTTGLVPARLSAILVGSNRRSPGVGCVAADGRHDAGTTFVSRTAAAGGGLLGFQHWRNWQPRNSAISNDQRRAGVGGVHSSQQ